jgi:competence protein ComEA
MLERFSAFLDKLSSLPYWQIALLALLVVGSSIGGYIILRPAPHPQSVFHSTEETAVDEPRQMTVYVTGAVNHPGVIRLDEGDRIIDAIEEAGGPLSEANLESLNLAQTVQDGQKILVPRVGETGSGGLHPSGETGNYAKVNINLADMRELEELPGIGPTLAERIVAYREKKGGFRSVDELKQVSGIGDKKFEEIRDLIEI